MVYKNSPLEIKEGILNASKHSQAESEQSLCERGPGRTLFIYLSLTEPCEPFFSEHLIPEQDTSAA